MLNSTILIGRLTRDPELRYTSQGTAVTNFGIAVEREYKKDETDFFNIVCWNKTAEAVAKNLTKGRLVAVHGRLQSRTVDKDGQRRTYVEVVVNTVQFLDYGQATSSKSGSESGQSYQSNNNTQMGFNDESSDDLPF